MNLAQLQMTRWSLIVTCFACCSIGWLERARSQQNESQTVEAIEPLDASIRIKLAQNTSVEAAIEIVSIAKKFGITQIEIVSASAGEESELNIVPKSNFPIERIGSFVSTLKSNAKTPIKINFEEPDINRIQVEERIIEEPNRNDVASGTADPSSVLEKRSLDIAKDLQKAKSNPTGSKLSVAELEQKTAQLTKIIEQAFDARQKKQRADLAAYKQRLRAIEEQIDARDRNRKQIIENRITELLDPNMQWQSTPQLASDSMLSKLEDERNAVPKSTKNPIVPSDAEQIKWLKRYADDQQSTQAGNIDSPLAFRERLIRFQEMVDRLNQALKNPSVAKDELDDLLRQRDKHLSEFKFTQALWQEKIAALKADLNLKQNETKLAKKEFQRATELFKKGAVGATNLESNKLQVERADIEEQRARSNLSMYQKAGEGIEVDQGDQDAQATKSASAESQGFEVLQLQKLDPTLAVASIKKFFGLSDNATSAGKGLIVDGDVAARQVWVKGTEEELRKVRDFVSKLDEAGSRFVGSCDLSGLVTYRGKPLVGKIIFRQSVAGDIYSIPVEDTGKFECKIPYGNYQVAFVSKDLETPPGTAKYQVLETSGMTVEINQSKEEFEIDLSSGKIVEKNWSEE